jgi:hypothetical protein
MPHIHPPSALTVARMVFDLIGKLPPLADDLIIGMAATAPIIRREGWETVTSSASMDGPTAGATMRQVQMTLQGIGRTVRVNPVEAQADDVGWVVYVQCVLDCAMQRKA